MKNTKKRGFTIVELVIVIAVIAILASALIPTFSGVVKKAKESQALQNARNAWTAYLVDNYDKVPTDDTCIESGEYHFAITNGQFTGKPCENQTAHKYYTIDENGNLVATTVATHTATPAQSGGQDGQG